MMGVGQGGVELPNCQNPFTHKLVKQVTIQNSPTKLTEAEIRVAIGETLKKSPDKEYICRFKVVIGSETKFVLGRVYWADHENWQVGLGIAPEPNPN